MLSGLQASLRTCHGLEVITLDGPATATELLATHPSVVIFEMDGIQSEFLLAQMQALPDLLLIGIDPESHEVLLSGQAARSITLDQIMHLVLSRETGSARPSRDDNL